MAKFNVFNETDGVFVNHRPLSSEQADVLISAFPQRFKHQGYYLTADGRRIDPSDVILVKQPSSFVKGISNRIK